MKFSDKTRKILDYLSDINPGIILEEGNTLYTVDPSKAIFVKATLDQDLEGSAAIYNLKNFMRILDLFDEPEVEFLDNRFAISGGNQKVSYTYASKEMVFSPAKKNIKMPSEDVEILVKWDDLSKALEAAGILGMDRLAITSDGEKAFLQVYDPKNSSSDKYSIELNAEELPDNEFTVLIKTANVKLIPDNYKVTIALGRLIKVESDTIEYYIAPEKE